MCEFSKNLKCVILCYQLKFYNAVDFMVIIIHFKRLSFDYEWPYYSYVWCIVIGCILLQSLNGKITRMSLSVPTNLHTME